MTARLQLAFARWPERHRAAWERATGPSYGLYDAGAAAARRRPGTIGINRRSYAYWLGFLDRHGWLDSRVPIAKTVTRERLDLYIAEQRARGNGNGGIKLRLRGLHGALRLMAPEVDFGFILRPGGISP